MNKSGTLITSALLALGLAAGAMAADGSRVAAQTSADAPAAPADAAKTAKPAKKSSSKKSSKSKKKSSSATTK